MILFGVLFVNTTQTTLTPHNDAVLTSFFDRRFVFHNNSLLLRKKDKGLLILSQTKMLVFAL